MRSLVGWGLLPLALGCSFDATGVDTAPPSSAASMDSNDGDDSTSAAPGTSTTDATTGPGTPTTGPEPEVTSEPLTTGPEPTTEPATSEPVTTGPETTDPSTTSTTSDTTSTTTGEPETTDPSTTSTTTGEPETTGPPACDNSFKQILRVKDAQVEAPMKAEMSMFEDDIVAYSETAEMGSVTFTFDLPCSGPVAVWGRVLDWYPGANNGDPDSYYVSLDGQREIDWGYGCQTSGQMAAYFWVRVYAGTFGQACNLATPWMLDLDAGTHSIRLRNREAKNGNARAAVARLLVTTDQGYVPSDMD